MEGNEVLVSSLLVSIFMLFFYGLFGLDSDEDAPVTLCHPTMMMLNMNMQLKDAASTVHMAGNKVKARTN